MNNQQNVHSTGPVPRDFAHIAVLGGGAWGTALALTAHRAGRRVSLYVREPEVRSAIQTRHENTAFLPGIALPSDLEVLDEPKAAATADAILLTVPAQFLHAELDALGPSLTRRQPIVICAKGLERRSGQLMTEMAAAAAPDAALAVLSGPSFAEDVARGLPTAVTLAAPSLDLAEALAASLATPSFRPYASDDPTGAAVGGAVKNVLAIACGIAEGRGFGASARAALIARGFAEMRRFASALGARPETLTGLSGLGDLVLTCSSPQSRNFSYGVALGEGATPDEAARRARGVVEGAATAKPVAERAATLGIAMPIAAAIAAIIESAANVDQAIAALLARPLRSEAE